MPPGQPRSACTPAGQPGYTRPAIDAITQAARAEHDFAGWLTCSPTPPPARLQQRAHRTTIWLLGS